MPQSGSWLSHRVFDVVVNGLTASYWLPARLRCQILKAFGFKLHSTLIRANVYFTGKHLTLGPRAFINHDCYIDSKAPISIGADTHIAMRSMLLTSTHPMGPTTRRAGPRESKPISIGVGCWLGAGVTVMPGVTIGDGCVIAAGAVVTRDCEPNGLYAGVPAVRKKDLPLDT